MSLPPVSRAGLARCPSCLTHVVVARDVLSTVCPFCSRTFAAPSAGATRAASSALVAALGLGLALSGCGQKSPPATAPPEPPESPEPSPPVQPQPEYGVPIVPQPDPDSADNAVPEVTAVAIYGTPPRPRGLRFKRKND